MATVSDGSNPGRGGKPQRQSPSPARHGRAAPQLDPTEQEGQTPGDIFGFSQAYSTGAKGTQGAEDTASTDVTIKESQLVDGFTGLTRPDVTSTGAPGTSGAQNRSGGENVVYTDPFGYMGQEHREGSTSGVISGDGDWTQANSDGYSGGPTLPGLTNARPTSTGAGKGSVGRNRKH